MCGNVDQNEGHNSFIVALLTYFIQKRLMESDGNLPEKNNKKNIIGYIVFEKVDQLKI